MAFKVWYPGYGQTIALSSTGRVKKTRQMQNKIWRGKKALPRPSKVKAV